MVGQLSDGHQIKRQMENVFKLHEPTPEHKRGPAANGEPHCPIQVRPSTGRENQAGGAIAFKGVQVQLG